MINRVKIAVVIPVYQVEKYLPTCLDSLIRQDFTERYQIILVDLGSTDSSSQICYEYEKKYPDKFYRLHSFPNHGVSSSRNIGLFVADSDYVTFVDADDYVSSSYLSYMYKEIKKSHADIVTVGQYCCQKKIKKDYSRINLTTSGKQALMKLYKSPFMKLRTFCWGRLYRTAFLKENHIFFPLEIDRFEDWPFISLALFYAKKVKYCSKPLYYYRIREGSAMHQVADMINPFLQSLKLTKSMISNIDQDFSKYLYSRPSIAIKGQLHHFCHLSSAHFKEKTSMLYIKALDELKKIYYLD